MTKRHAGFGDLWLASLVMAGIHMASIISPRAAAADTVDKRPNILFIYTDDQSHRTVSCYPESYDWVHTPHIDTLAREGVRFTNAYIGTWCMPSRATLLTGHHSFGVESLRMVGAYPGSTYDPNQCPFWPKVFRQHGYVTAQIGKWHTGADAGFGRDWDFQMVWNRPADPGHAGPYYDQQLITVNGGKPQRISGYTTDNYTRWAVDFIRGQHRPAGKPWYLWLCYGAVHGPSIPAERHRDAHPGATVPVPSDIYAPRPGKPAYMQHIASWAPGPDGQPVSKSNGPSSGAQKTLADAVRQYQQCVLAIDDGLGQLLATLDETKQRENTLIVFTSDQGFAWGQHGFRAKLAPYDANLRAPLIFSMPGTLPQGAVCQEPVGGADLVPTFFHFAQIDLPWPMHGHDLAPLLRDPKSDWPHPVLMAMTGASYGSDASRVQTGETLDRSGVPWWVFLRTGRYKYIRTLVEGEMEELYDLENDPEELTNLALDANFAARLADLREATIAELRRTGAAMVDNLPAVRQAAE